MDSIERGFYVSIGCFMFASVALSSCTLEPYEIPQEEAYTRSFIKTFGLIDEAQDWNLAKSVDVNVNVGAHASQVKVYAKVGSKYYLTANLIDMSGELTIPIDIPETTTDIMVKVDGVCYYTQVGMPVNAVAQSRSIADGAGKSATFTHGGTSYTVSVSAAYATGDEEYFKFNAQQMGPILSPSENRQYDGTLLSSESYTWPDYYSITGENKWIYNTSNLCGLVPENEGNVGKEKVYQDIRITRKGTSLVMYPMYWFTSNSHLISIYLIDDDDQPVRVDGKILTFPVYQAKSKNDIQYYNHDYTSHDIGGVVNKAVYPSGLTFTYDNVTYDQWSDLFDGANVVSGRLAALKQALINYYSDIDAWTYCTPCGTSTNVGMSCYDVTFPDPLPNTPNYNLCVRHNKIEDDENGSYVLSTGTETIPSVLTEEGGYWCDCRYHDYGYSSIFNSGGFAYSSGSYAFKAPGLMRSHGVKIDINGWSGRVGLCTTINTGHTLYSQSSVNKTEKVNTNGYGSASSVKSRADGDDDVDYQYSYSAFYFHPYTNRLFYSFEDWLGGDHDLNDLVFMIEGVDHMDTDKGEIPVKDASATHTDKTISWILAAEDLGSIEDFDFNDMIVQLSSITTNVVETINLWGDVDKTQLLSSTVKTTIHKEVRLQALAAGGTLPLYLHFYDTAANKDYLLGPNNLVAENDNSDNYPEYEWHQWFGNYSHRTMINTGAGPTVPEPYYCVVGYTDDISEVSKSRAVEENYKINAFKDFSIADYCQKLTDRKVAGFYITVGTSKIGSEMNDIGDERMLTASSPGAAPQMFLIPDKGYDDKGWYWPSEYTHILDVYPGFAEWVQKASFTSWHTTEPISQRYIRAVNF